MLGGLLERRPDAAPWGQALGCPHVACPASSWPVRLDGELGDSLGQAAHSRWRRPLLPRREDLRPLHKRQVGRPSAGASGRVWRRTKSKGMGGTRGVAHNLRRKDGCGFLPEACPAYVCLPRVVLVTVLVALLSLRWVSVELRPVLLVEG